VKTQKHLDAVLALGRLQGIILAMEAFMNDEIGKKITTELRNSYESLSEIISSQEDVE